MKNPFGVPRLLPITIFALAGLLAVKSSELVRAAAISVNYGAPVVAAAQASTPAKPHDPAPAASLPPPVAPPAPSKDAGPPPVTDGERTVLLELRERRQELDSRETALVARESLMAATEQRLAARVTELQVLQKRLETLEASRKDRDDASWQGLVKLYETMKPREAATIFNDLEMPVLLHVVDRMKETKAAPILAAMLPDKARDVTTQLAQMRTRRDAPGNSAAGS